MSEEEKRRCIILGICQTAARPGEEEAPPGNRLDTLRACLSASTLSEDDAQIVLGLIDEALAMQGL